MPQYTVIGQAQVLATVTAADPQAALTAWREIQRKLTGMRLRGAELVVEARKPAVFDDAGKALEVKKPCLTSTRNRIELKPS